MSSCAEVGSTTTLTASDPNLACSSSPAMSGSKYISYEKPEHPPGRTATRSAISSPPSASSSSLTLVAALSVRVITIGSSEDVLSVVTLPGGDGDPTGMAVGGSTELADLG